MKTRASVYTMLLTKLYNTSNSICKCDTSIDSVRIKCLVDAYSKLMSARCLPISKSERERLLSYSHLAEVKFETVETESLAQSLPENQIFYTFIQEYIKTHPSFLRDGPELGDLKLRVHFFAST